MIPDADYEEASGRLNAARACLDDALLDTFYNGMTSDDPEDVGYQLGLNDPSFRPGCPAVWEATTTLEEIVEWNLIDYEFAAPTTSYFSLPDGLDSSEVPIVTGGYENLPLILANQVFGGSQNQQIDFNTKVTMVDYEHDNPDYPVMTTVEGDSGCDFYLSKYIILTVSVGVLQSESISYNPPLAYPVDTNPYDFEIYQRIYYKFSGVVGENYDKTLLVTYDEADGYNEIGHHWHNIAIHGMGDGSVWFVTLVSAEVELLASQNDGGETFSAEQIDMILDRLRLAFPDDAAKMEMGQYESFYPDLRNRESYGFGSYGNFRVGATLTENFYPFYGGGIEQTYCQHNGCDSTGRWRLHFSGSASCYEFYELVDGAVYSAERSVNYILFDMGRIDDYQTAQLTFCDDIDFLEDIFANEGGFGGDTDVDDGGFGGGPLCAFFLFAPLCWLLDFLLSFFA